MLIYITQVVLLTCGGLRMQYVYGCQLAPEKHLTFIFRKTVSDGPMCTAQGMTPLFPSATTSN